MAKSQKRRLGFRCTAVALLLLVLYPLSIGPVWYLNNSCGFVLGNAYHWFYDPIWKFTEGTPLERPFGRYYGWWIVFKYPGLEQLRRDWERQQAVASPSAEQPGSTTATRSAESSKR